MYGVGTRSISSYSAPDGFIINPTNALCLTEQVPLQTQLAAVLYRVIILLFKRCGYLPGLLLMQAAGSTIHPGRAVSNNLCSSVFIDRYHLAGVTN